MTNELEAIAGYEPIGMWQVSEEIPEEQREMIRNQFRRFEEGTFVQGKRVQYLDLNAIKKIGLTPEDEKVFLDLYQKVNEGIASESEESDAELILSRHFAKREHEAGNRYHSYFEGMDGLARGSGELPPDPFVEMHLYWLEEENTDIYDKIKGQIEEFLKDPFADTPINQAVVRMYQRRDEDHIKKRIIEVADKLKKETLSQKQNMYGSTRCYWFNVSVNWRTREARIEPVKEN